MADDIENILFAAADKMRGAMDPGEYKHVALGLIFLRYVSAAFDAKQAEFIKRKAFAEAKRKGETDEPFPAGWSGNDEYIDLEEPEDYAAENAFWVPEKARWSLLAANAKANTIGVMVDDAMREIEKANASLKDALPKVYGKPDLDRAIVTGLIEMFTNLELHGTKADFDLIGRIYEYFIGKFATAEGKLGGEFYTPKSIVAVMVEMMEPTHGRVYDPCCGSGGFFVQSEKFISAHQGRVDDIAVYGQERNPATFRLARMNLAIRGIFADIRWNSEGTLLRNAFPDERFDFILANPPFNISDWSGELLREDKRWAFGTPPERNANFAWIAHIHHHLAANGIGGVVMANGSMSSMQSGEGEIRQAMVTRDAVDAVVTLPGQLFFGTQIPACIWILAKDKSNGTANGEKLRDRRGEVLFIDARKMGALVPGSRKQKELSDTEIEKIADTYHAWRGEKSAGMYVDEAGFCASATIEEIKKHNFVMTPGRYVGAGAAEEDGEPFVEKFDRLMGELREQFAQGRRLEAEIEAKLGTLV